MEDLPWWVWILLTLIFVALIYDNLDTRRRKKIHDEELKKIDVPRHTAESKRLINTRDLREPPCT